MRYVIVIVGIAIFVIWDAIYNGSQYTDAGLKAMRDAVRYVTG